MVCFTLGAPESRRGMALLWRACQIVHLTTLLATPAWSFIPPGVPCATARASVFRLEAAAVTVAVVERTGERFVIKTRYYKDQGASAEGNWTATRSYEELDVFSQK